MTDWIDFGPILDEWIAMELDRQAEERARPVAAPRDVHFDVAEELDRRIAYLQAEMARPFMHLFGEDNSTKSLEEMKEITDALSPGGAHSGGLLVRIVMQTAAPIADRTLIAALIVRNWHGGRAGFQFLPDPKETDLCDYLREAIILADTIRDGLGSDPTRFSKDEDRLFFERMPDTFTVYRGCSGISAEKAGLGICWTTSRQVAEWFALRSPGPGSNQPILLTARVRKSQVLFAKASESEVVVCPAKSRELKIQKRIGSANSLSP